MRRLTAIVAAMMLATLPLSAQEHKRPDYGKNEIGVSYGYLTNNMTVAVFAEVLTLGQANIDTFYSGGASINYLHYVHPSSAWVLWLPMSMAGSQSMPPTSTTTTTR